MQKQCSNGHYKPVDEFTSARGQECKLCLQCRQVKSSWKKRKREQDPEWWKLERKRGNSLLTAQLSIYKSRAKKRGIEWTLTDDYACSLFQLACFYCNESPALWSGLDRFDNAYGYTFANSVPCCSFCNVLKLDWSIASFIAICGHVARQVNITFPDVNPQNVTFSKYVRAARKRGLEFALTRDEFVKVTSGACVYCGKRNSETHRNGIDRRNNEPIYNMQTSQPACGTCNTAKFSYTEEQFLGKCRLVWSRCKHLVPPEILSGQVQIYKRERQ